MAREYFCAYHSLLESLTPYGDAECGRIFRAALRYSATGEEEEFRGNERFIWPTLKAQIDRDRSAYDEQCEKQRVNGSKGGRPKKAVAFSENQKNPPVFSETQKTQEEEKEKEEDKEEILSAAPGNAQARATGEVMAYFFDRINAAPSPDAIDTLKSYIQTLSAPVVLHALQTAVDEKKTGFSYIKAILQRYAQEDLHSLEAVQQAEAEHERRKEKREKGVNGNGRENDPTSSRKRNWGIQYD